MITLQYVISSILLIFPFIIAGIIEAVYDKLFLKRGKVLDLASGDINYNAAQSCAFDNTFRSVFLFDTNAGQRCYLIGTENPNVFLATDLAAVAPVPTALSDYSNKFEIRFTGANRGLNFNIFHNNTNLGSGSFTTRRIYSFNQNVLYQYHYGEWLAVTLVAVFGISVLRILYKEVTISNLVQATTKFRVGLFGVDTSLEEGRGFTVIKALKAIFNFWGWIVSIFVFPTSNLMFFISFLIMFITFCISIVITYDELQTTLQEGFTAQDKAIVIGVSIGIIVLFIGFRYLSDTREPGRNVLSSDKSLIPPSAAVQGIGKSGTEASIMAKKLTSSR
tara:strand:- start:7045 stop:8046 length:1002 start_codon:yes stop_codon:yes gene_type:complete